MVVAVCRFTAIGSLAPAAVRPVAAHALFARCFFARRSTSALHLPVRFIIRQKQGIDSFQRTILRTYISKPFQKVSLKINKTNLFTAFFKELQLESKTFPENPTCDDKIFRVLCNNGKLARRQTSLGDLCFTPSSKRKCSDRNFGITYIKDFDPFKSRTFERGDLSDNERRLLLTLCKRDRNQKQTE